MPAEAMLGQQGSGFKIAMHALDGGRINIAACRCGCGCVCGSVQKEEAVLCCVVLYSVVRLFFVEEVVAGARSCCHVLVCVC